MRAIRPASVRASKASTAAITAKSMRASAEPTNTSGSVAVQSPTLPMSRAPRARAAAIAPGREALSIVNRTSAPASISASVQRSASAESS